MLKIRNIQAAARGLHAAQTRVLCCQVEVFAVVKISCILTTCPCFDNLNWTFLMQVILSATLSRLLPLQLGSEHFQFISFR